MPQCFTKFSKSSKLSHVRGQSREGCSCGRRRCRARTCVVSGAKRVLANFLASAQWKCYLRVKAISSCRRFADELLLISIFVIAEDTSSKLLRFSENNSADDRSVPSGFFFASLRAF